MTAVSVIKLFPCGYLGSKGTYQEGCVGNMAFSRLRQKTEIH